MAGKKNSRKKINKKKYPLLSDILHHKTPCFSYVVCGRGKKSGTVLTVYDIIIPTSSNSIDAFAINNLKKSYMREGEGTIFICLSYICVTWCYAYYLLPNYVSVVVIFRKTKKIFWMIFSRRKDSNIFPIIFIPFIITRRIVFFYNWHLKTYVVFMK